MSRESSAERPKQRIALHEAGHAVVGIRLGLTLDGGVEFSEHEEDGGGVALVHNPLAGWQRGDGNRQQLAMKYALMLFAGAAAERLGGFEPAAEYGDYETARYWLARYATPRGARFRGDDAHDRQEERLKKSAERRVSQHAREIQRVSDALLRSGALSADDVLKLLS